MIESANLQTPPSDHDPPSDYAESPDETSRGAKRIPRRPDRSPPCGHELRRRCADAEEPRRRPGGRGGGRGGGDAAVAVGGGESHGWHRVSVSLEWSWGRRNGVVSGANFIEICEENIYMRFYLYSVFCNLMVRLKVKK